MANFLRSFATGFVSAANQRFDENRRLEVAKDLQFQKAMTEDILPSYSSSITSASSAKTKTKNDALTLLEQAPPSAGLNLARYFVETGVIDVKELDSFLQGIPADQRAKLVADPFTFDRGQPFKQSLSEEASNIGSADQFKKFMQDTGLDPNQARFQGQQGRPARLTDGPPGASITDFLPEEVTTQQNTLISQAINSVASQDSDKFFANQKDLSEFIQAISSGDTKSAFEFISPQLAIVGGEDGATTELQDQWFTIIQKLNNPVLRAAGMTAVMNKKYGAAAEIIARDPIELDLGPGTALYIKEPIALSPTLILPGNTTTAGFKTPRGTYMITVNENGEMKRYEIPSVSAIKQTFVSPTSPGPSGEQKLSLSLEVAQQKRGVKLVSQMRQAIESGEMPGGLLGAFKGFTQTIIGQIKDFADFFSDDKKSIANLLVTSAGPDSPVTPLSASEAAEFTEQFEQDVTDFMRYNPNIQRAHVRASYVALLLAFSRFPRGRINVTVIRETTALSNPFRGSRQDVIIRLDEIEKELQARSETAQEQLQVSIPLSTISFKSFKVRTQNGRVIQITVDDIIQTAREEGLPASQVDKQMRDPQFLKDKGLTLVK